MLTGPFQALVPIVLASASPRRRDFLKDMGLSFRIVLPQKPEARREAGETPMDFVRRAAQEKAADVALRERNAVVIGADTIVAHGDEIMGKPSSPDEALLMLARLSGALHQVVTACCVFFPDGECETHLVSTQVRMASYDQKILQRYVATAEGADKAGSYAIQGIGAFLVERINGSWTNVAGLPVAELTHLLLNRGAIGPAEA